MNQEQKELLEEATAPKKEYYKFESGKRKDVIVTEFKFTRENVPDYNDKDTTVNKVCFTCKVLEAAQEFEFSTLSVRFMNAIKPFIIEKEPSDLIALSIKKIGEGTDTQYDIEERSN